jgi:hypothetical protein
MSQLVQQSKGVDPLSERAAERRRSGARVCMATCLSVAALVAAPPAGAAGNDLDPPVAPRAQAQPWLSVTPVVEVESPGQVNYRVSGGPGESQPSKAYVRIRGLPTAAELSAGHPFTERIRDQANPERVWVVPLKAAEGLTVQMPAGVSGNSDLIITLVDGDGRVLAEKSAELRVTPQVAASTDNIPPVVTEPARGVPPSEPAAVPPPSEKVVAAPPSEPTAVPPAPEKVVAAPPSEPAAVPPAPEKVVVAPPSEPTAVSPPPEKVVATPPSEPAVAPPAPEKVVAAPPSEPAAVSPPPEKVVVAQPSEPAAVPPPPEKVVAALPGEPPAVSPSPEKAVVAPPGEPAAATPPARDKVAAGTPGKATASPDKANSRSLSIRNETKTSALLPPGPAVSSRASPAPPAATCGPPDARPAPSSEDLAQAERLLAKGEGYLARGDIAMARQYFERAVDLGLPIAALRMAETHDPRELARRGVRGVKGDLEEARRWYLRALDLEVPEAESRLRRLGSQ